MLYEDFHSTEERKINMSIPLILCMALASILSVDAHEFAPPRKSINYTITVGTRPMNIERFVASFNSDLAICNDQVYRSTIFYCYTRKSKIKLKKCRAICGGSTSSEIALCQSRCPMYSTCNWGQKDDNQTYCEKYFDYPKPIITTTTITANLPTTEEANATQRSDWTVLTESTSTDTTSSSCQCHCPDYPAAATAGPTHPIPFPTYQDNTHEQNAQVVIDEFIVWLLLTTVFVLLVLIIVLLVLVAYLVVRQCRNDRERRVGNEDVGRPHSIDGGYVPVPQDEAQEEIALDPQNDAALYCPAAVDNSGIARNREVAQIVTETAESESREWSYENQSLDDVLEESDDKHDEETVATPKSDRSSDVSDVFEDRPAASASARERRSSFAMAGRHMITPGARVVQTFPPDSTQDSSQTVRRRRRSEPLITLSSKSRGMQRPRFPSTGSYKDPETEPLRGGEDTDSGSG